MEQLLLHAIGDYYFQTDYQAMNKKKAGKEGFYACLKHCVTYSLPFLLITSWQATLIIFITHFIIDRSNLVAYGIAIKNGTKKKPVMERSFPYNYDISNFGFASERPFAITIWLYIICDNILHVVCNYMAIKYL